MCYVVREPGRGYVLWGKETRHGLCVMGVRRPGRSYVLCGKVTRHGLCVMG